jgi:hypothetical protein
MPRKNSRKPDFDAELGSALISDVWRAIDAAIAAVAQW